MPVAPPPDIINGDICEMTVRGQLCGQTILTVVHWKADFEEPVAMDLALDSLNTAIREVDSIRDKYVAAAAQNFSLVELVLQMIYPVRFARFTYGFTEVGTQTGEAKTADLAAVLERSSFFATDRNLGLSKGRYGNLHFAPVPGTKIEEGIVDSTYRTNFLGPLANVFTSPIISAGAGNWIPVLYHAHADPVSTTELNRWSIKAEARVMRRRTVGVGI